MSDQPNVVFFHVDNLGFGELGCYGGGILRGASTTRTDGFAAEGCQLLNHAPEAQCTPCRSALLTGRHAIRSGTHTVAMPEPGSQGLVAWERTLGDIFSEGGYATACLGKWHVGDGSSRWPTGTGFDTWFGPPHSYDEGQQETDPWYRPGRDPVAHMLEGTHGEEPRPAVQLTCWSIVRELDAGPADRVPARAQGHRHAAQPHRRDPASGGFALADPESLDWRAARSRVRRKRAIVALYTAAPACAPWRARRPSGDTVELLFENSVGRK